MSNEDDLSFNDLLSYFFNVQNQNSMKMQECFNENSETLKNVQRLLESINNKMNNFEWDRSTMPKSKTEEGSEEDTYGTPTSSPICEASTSAKIVDVAMDEIPDEENSKSPEIYCFDCKRSFVRGSGKFTRHIRESSCKPYQCHCGKLFKKKSSLKGHKSTHSLAEFPCTCGAIFRCEQYLKNHKRRKNCINQQLASQSLPVTANHHIEDVSNDTPVDDLEESFFTPMNLLRLHMQD